MRRVKKLAINGKPKYISYTRVSTEEQARDGVSLGAQEAKVRAYAALTEAEVVDVLVDAGLSGRSLERPALLEALKRVEAGEADALVVPSLDRLSRSTLDFLAVVERLRDAGRGFVSVREQLDTSMPHGRFTMTILAALAEMERDLISARCREAAERCRATGRVYGRTPFGCRRDGIRLLPDEAEAEVLREMREMRDAGMAFSAVANELNARGRRSKRGGRWYASSVRSVLRTSASLGAVNP